MSIKRFIHILFNLSIAKILKKLKGKNKREKSLNYKLTDAVGRSEKYDLIFIHNPKVAGTSLMELLEIPMFFNHSLPCRRFSVEEWENNTFMVVVRHPIDRLVSAFFYHTGNKYFGGYMKLFPNLKEISTLYDYFINFCSIENTITPQYNYIHRPGSKKTIDHILKYENLENDLSTKLNIESTLPLKNKTARKNKPSLTKKQFDIILNYYHKDFEIFGYSVEKSHDFVKVAN